LHSSRGSIVQFLSLSSYPKPMKRWRPVQVCLLKAGCASCDRQFHPHISQHEQVAALTAQQSACAIMRGIYDRHLMVYCAEWKGRCRMTTLRTPALAELLKQYRLAAGLTQEELAERAGISVRAIGALEQGVRRRPHRETLRLLAEALSLSNEERAQLFEALRASRRGAVVPSPTAQTTALLKHFPVTLTPLIGREREASAIAQLLLQEDVRLLTLTGTAGIGKTRLGTHVAVRLGAHFATVVFVSLASISDPSLVVPAIGQALGLHEQSNQPAIDQLYEHLSRRELLLVLDNFEQVVQAGPAIGQLLAACPRVKALVTSRVALRVRGEHEFAVSPLQTPELARPPRPEDLTRYAAVTLFVQQARAVKPHFAVTPAHAPVIAAICARLDGIPLALELAAARIKLLPPQALLARLDESLALLTNGPADLPERQQTMRRAIAWSYDLLTASQQRLFRRLAVFVDGWTLEAAEDICGWQETPTASVLDGLASLVGSSLVLQVENSEGEPRFRLLQLLREYGWEQLVAHSEASLLRSRHADYYRALAEQAAPEMHGPNQRPWLARLAQEHPNLRAALTWARETQAIDCGLRMGSALYWFWQLYGHAGEGRAWLGHFLSLQRPSETVGDNALRADALTSAGHLAWVQGDHEAATALLAEGLERYREQTNMPGVAQVLNNQGMIADEQGDYARAVALFEASLALWRELRDVTKIGSLLTNLACVAFRQERYAQAISLFEEGLALHRAAQDQWSVAVTLCNLGEAMRMEGHLTAAALLIEEGLEVHRALGDRGEIAYALVNLADVMREQGDLERAAMRNHEALVIAREVGAPFAVVGALDSMAEIAYSQGRSALATQVFALTTILRETHHMPRSGRHAKLCATRINALHATLGEKAFTAAWVQGQNQSVDEAIQLMSALLCALETVPPSTNATAPGRCRRA
jgi:predicted ATPase/transcriptional regulator with XRE-family HTH domain